MTWMIAALGALLPGLVTGLVLAGWNRRQKAADDRKAREEALRTESDLMRLDLEVATAQLSYAVAMAVRRGSPNGEMEVAIARYERAMEKFRKFERKQLVMQ